MKEWLSTPDEFAQFMRLYRKSGQVRTEVADFAALPGTPDEQAAWRHFTEWLRVTSQPGLAKAVLDYLAGRRLT